MGFKGLGLKGLKVLGLGFKDLLFDGLDFCGSRPPALLDEVGELLFRFAGLGSRT